MAHEPALGPVALRCPIDLDLEVDRGLDLEFDLVEFEIGAAQPDQDGCWLYEGEDVACELLIARRDSP